MFVAVQYWVPRKRAQPRRAMRETCVYTVDDLAFQCPKLESTYVRPWTRDNARATHHEGLIESEHHDEFDAHELCQGPTALQFITREAIEHEKAIQSNAVDAFRYGG